LVFAFIELKKFKKQEHELQTNEDRWLFFLKEISRKEELPGALAQNEFADACHTLEKEAWPDDERDAYEKAFILQTDARGKIIAAEGKALAMGIEKGM
ncbi:hypothetical protein FJ364_06105, partial [Candidatus Dependentiae bacterium]|nr:hypothetical protein [Candidatus Dependentiae bacterium]